MTRLVALALPFLLAAPAWADEPPPEDAPSEAPATEEPTEQGPKPPPPKPAPYFYAQPVFGGIAFPLGASAYGSPQIRMSLYRSESKLFQTTHFGIGPWFKIAPAFAEIGGRLDFTPVEVLSLAVTARYIHTFDNSAGSRFAEADLADKTYRTRADYEGPPRSTGAFDLRISPTLRLKGGPVIFLYNFFWTHLSLFFRDGEEPENVYDAALDLWVAPTERVISQQAVVMGEIFDGVRAKSVLRLGATVRHRRARFSGDRMVNVGFIGTFKPGPHMAIPEIIVQILPYVLDDAGGRVLGPPHIVIAFRWTVQKGPGTVGIPEIPEG